MRPEPWEPLGRWQAGQRTSRTVVFAVSEPERLLPRERLHCLPGHEPTTARASQGHS